MIIEGVDDFHNLSSYPLFKIPKSKKAIVPTIVYVDYLGAEGLINLPRQHWNPKDGQLRILSYKSIKMSVSKSR